MNRDTQLIFFFSIVCPISLPPITEKDSWTYRYQTLFPSLVLSSAIDLQKDEGSLRIRIGNT